MFVLRGIRKAILICESVNQGVWIGSKALRTNDHQLCYDDKERNAAAVIILELELLLLSLHQNDVVGVRRNERHSTHHTIPVRPPLFSRIGEEKRPRDDEGNHSSSLNMTNITFLVVFFAQLTSTFAFATIITTHNTTCPRAHIVVQRLPRNPVTQGPDDQGCHRPRTSPPPPLLHGAGRAVCAFYWSNDGSFIQSAQPSA